MAEGMASSRVSVSQGRFASNPSFRQAHRKRATVLLLTHQASLLTVCSPAAIAAHVGAHSFSASSEAACCSAAGAAARWGAAAERTSACRLAGRAVRLPMRCGLAAQQGCADQAVRWALAAGIRRVCETPEASRWDVESLLWSLGGWGTRQVCLSAGQAGAATFAAAGRAGKMSLPQALRRSFYYSCRQHHTKQCFFFS